MNQSDIPSPVITNGSGYSVFYNAYLHFMGFLLRNLVSYLGGRHEGFDKDLVIQTPGLGSGSVNISVCLAPEHQKPSRLDGSRPLVLVMEGGGFVLGQPKDGRRNDRKIADETGAIVISVEYAKSPRYEYPHALLQIYEVLKWSLSREAENEGIKVDPSRIAVLGNSAGGNLAAALSLLVSFNSGPCAAFRQSLLSDFRLLKQVLIYPSLELTASYEDRFNKGDENVRAKSLPPWLACMMEGSYLPPYINKKQIFISPLIADTHLLEQLDLPPAVIITAGLDVLKYEAEAYAEKLQKAKVDVKLTEYPLGVHGFTHFKEDSKGFRKEDVQNSWDEICSSLNTAFRESK